MRTKLGMVAAGFAFLETPERGATPLEWQLRYYDRYLEWAVAGIELVLIVAFAIPAWAARVDAFPAASEAGTINSPVFDAISAFHRK